MDGAQVADGNQAILKALTDEESCSAQGPIVAICLEVFSLDEALRPEFALIQTRSSSWPFWDDS